MSTRDYDYEKAKRTIQLKSDILESATMGIAEDWYWTAEPVFENGSMLVDLDTKPAIGGITGTNWGTPSGWCTRGTPSLLLTFKDGTEDMIECYIGRPQSQDQNH